ncbi:MAG TPA: CAP domain-containing protein [Micromonosporaceae bacterium]
MRGAHARRSRFDLRPVVVAVGVFAVVVGGAIATNQAFSHPAKSPASDTSRADRPSLPSGKQRSGAPVGPTTAPGSARAPSGTQSPAPAAGASSVAATGSSAPGSPPVILPPPGNDPPRHGTQAQRVQELKLINRARQDNGGVAALHSNSQLQAAAQSYAEHLAADGQFSHTDGSQIGDRVTAAGYDWQTVGENLGLGQTTPADVLAAWMASPDHRAVMLNPAFVDVGIGIATRSDGRVVWCVDLAARR